MSLMVLQVPERVSGHAHGRQEADGERLAAAGVVRQIGEGVDAEKGAEILQQGGDADPGGGLAGQRRAA